MISNNIKLFLALFCLIIGSLSLVNESYSSAIIMLLFFGYWIYNYLRHSSVFMAFRYIQKQNFEKSRKLISLINNPNQLSKKSKGYYYICKGILSENENDIKKAEEYFCKALEFEKNIRNASLVYLNLAQIYVVKKEYDKVMTFLHKSKQLPHKKEVELHFREIEQKIEVK